MVEFRFFWSQDYPENAWLSNWHPCHITHDGEVFSSSEQLFMYLKAKLFGDEKMMSSILASKTPKSAKALGRKVKPFDEDVWVDKRVELMTVAVQEKFSQNEDLKTLLLSTGDDVLVETSPYDKVWGIGVRGRHKKASFPDQWSGLNLLGEILMKVRKEL